jgi:hypothetical protein
VEIKLLVSALFYGLVIFLVYLAAKRTAQAIADLFEALGGFLIAGALLGVVVILIQLYPL